uniref:Cytochrome P450 71AT248 n=1 Tax=Callicarpa americana TaxID=204211 RepID=A0A9Y1LM74_CALAM|nr:cytochrome P450 71AT248 [Callicarpa americana]
MAMLLPSLALLVTIFFLVARRKGLRKEPRHPPGPPSLPLIGNLHQYPYNSNLHICFSKLSYKYGPLIYMKIVKLPIIVISSANLAKQALMHNDRAFSGRPCTIASAKLSYNNLDIVCSSYSSYWREMRKIIVLHLFTHKQVHSFRPVRRDEVSRVINEISKRANSNQVINLGEIILSFTIGLTCRVAFGKRHEEYKRFDKVLDDLQTMMVGVFVADHFPSLGWIDKLTGMTSRLDKIFKDLDSFYQQLIDEHLSPSRPNSMDGDVIDLLIQLREQHASIGWDNIKAILMNVFAAGTETSAVVLKWAMTALMKKPSAMKKAQQEIRSLVGKKGRVEEDDIDKLHYLKAVIKETMRLYPPVPLSLPRETTERCTINGYEIEPKTWVFVNLWAIGRDPETWENPNEFLPERFLNNTIDFKGQDFGLIPFGSGRRICPGLSLGVAAVELALANLLYSFDWELPDGMKEDDIDTETLPGVTLRKKNDLCLVAKSYV